MFEAIKSFREKLDSNQTCLGAGITLTDSAIVEVLAPHVDFLWIDMEHTYLSFESVHKHLIAARATNTPALVRARSSDFSQMKPLLDTGADGLIIPQVRSADEVREVVNNCRYAPLGNRGFGPRRASQYGEVSGQEYLTQANENVFIAVQIENQSALADVEEIAQLEGLDSLALGPFDLSIALGFGGDLERPTVQDALSKIVQTARQAGKYIGSGMGAYAPAAEALYKLGVQWLQCGDDYGYMQDGLAKLKKELGEQESSQE